MDAAVALQRKKTIKFLCIVDFPLSKQGIFFITLTHVKSYIQACFECGFYFFALYSVFPHVIVNMGDFFAEKDTHNFTKD